MRWQMHEANLMHHICSLALKIYTLSKIAKLSFAENCGRKVVV